MFLTNRKNRLFHLIAFITIASLISCVLTFEPINAQPMDDTVKREIRDQEYPSAYVDVIMNRIQGRDFDASTTITLTIDGTNQWTKDSNSSGRVDFYLDPFDILPGQTVHMTDGIQEVTYVVEDIAVTAVDQAADTVSGTADPEIQITVTASNSDGSDTVERIVFADPSGNWVADFSGLKDLIPGSKGYAVQDHVDGHSTRIYWFIPDPYLSAYPMWDDASGYKWTQLTTITLTIQGSQWTEQSDGEGNVDFELTPFDLLAGQTIHMTDGTYEITYVVKDVAVTNIDQAADTVSGTADPGSDLSVSAVSGDYTSSDEIDTVTDPSGIWQVDFSGSVDLSPGAYGWVDQYDEDGNYTEIYWFIPDPYITVHPLTDTIQGEDWTKYADIDLAIDGTNQWTGQSNYAGGVEFTTDPFDILAGQTVVMSDGTYQITYVVENLTVSNVDQDTDIVSGTADPGSEIEVTAFSADKSSWKLLNTTADGSGNWQADYTGLVDISPGAYGRAIKYDTDKNSTEVEWSIPVPYFSVYPTTDEILGYDWRPNTTITLTVDDNRDVWTGQSDENGFVSFNIDPYDILTGFTVNMTDGSYGVTYNVQNIEITDVNQNADIITGTADPGSEITIHVRDGEDNLHTFSATADGSGEWEKDLNGIVDLGPGFTIEATVSDGKGNTSVAFWEITNSYFYIPYFSK